jgi:hypothetical protein
VFQCPRKVRSQSGFGEFFNRMFEPFVEGKNKSASPVRIEKMEFEFTRMAVVYLHLIACCVAIGMVFTSDLAMVKKLLRANANDRENAQHLSQLQRTVSHALVALWLTGVAIVSLDASIKGWEYFANPKLQSKITIVLLLTFNGMLLHKYVLPLLQKAGSLLRMSFSQSLPVRCLGSHGFTPPCWVWAAR